MQREHEDVLVVAEAQHARAQQRAGLEIERSAGVF